MCHSFTWWCSWITHFIKIFQCVLLSKATFLGGGGEGSGDCLMQNLPWKSWGTSHDWRQDLHSDSLMHFTLWWHCMLHSSWKRAYIRSLSSFFLSLIFFFFFILTSGPRRGPICGGELILPLGRDALVTCLEMILWTILVT